ncbi:hypothetical protein ACFW31_01195 [Nocardiopsis alba]|uniref:hypothetical protein n=1 Tax=Nocardiopsis alba TaxID=53437 RepID=UPI00366BA287
MTAERNRFGAFNVVILLFALLLVYLGATNIDRGVRAATADGVAGSFTASDLSCVQHPGHESCTCDGAYLSDDGALEREEVYMYGRDRESCLLGDPVAAVDIGARTRVYGPEGSHEWIWIAGMIALGAGLGAWGARPLFRPTRPRK